jgi:formylglycine-generating enzyme required for sulfatase activity
MELLHTVRSKSGWLSARSQSAITCGEHAAFGARVLEGGSEMKADRLHLSARRVALATCVLLMVCGCGGTHLERKGLETSSDEPKRTLIVLQERPDPFAVPVVGMRARIESSGLPWRVLLLPDAIEFVQIPSGAYSFPFDEIADDYEPWTPVVGELTQPLYAARFELPAAFAASDDPTWLRDVEVRLAEFLGRVGYADRTEFRLSLNKAAVGVTYSQASRIASSLGCRLPTEFEWFCLAYGGDVNVSDAWSGRSKAPAGNTGERSVFRRTSGLNALPTRSDGVMFLSDSGAFRANGFGVFDVVGNATEWATLKIPKASYEEPGAFDLNSVIRTLQDAADDPEGILCGNSWLSDHRPSLQIQWRHMRFRKFADSEFAEITSGVRLVLDGEVARELLRR